MSFNTENRNNLQEPIALGFLRNCSLFPERNALFINNEFYTYSQLFSIVYKVYSQIVDCKTNHYRIGIYCTDDVQTYASILAVSLYGAAYVPLNPKFPAYRNRFIVEEADLDLIINSTGIQNRELFEDKILIDLDKGIILSAVEINEDLDLKKVNQPLAYILFTSGTTGQPKGVPVSKANGNHFFSYYRDKSLYDFSEKDRFIQVYELTFDVSVFSFFMPLQVGACCYVVPQKGIRFLEIAKILKEQHITVISMVPTILQFMDRYMDEMIFPELRYSFFSGDKLSHGAAAKWAKRLPNGRVYNFYGPTETTIVCTVYPWNEADSALESVNDVVPLGKPFPGMDFIIINKDNEMIENNEPGELCFSGTQVIEAYLNNTNTDKFIEFDFKGEKKRFYKTGDLASVNAKGNLVFYGRIDSQVKINGHRIEIGEVEACVRKLTDSSFVVSCFKDKNGINQLVLFITNTQLEIKALKDNLAEVLPEYMIPQKIISVDKIPLSLNNKVDQQVLREFFEDTW